MLEIKVVCNCGQKFKFDVEPVNGVMPFVVNCPVCGADGTPAANAILARSLPAPTPAPIPTIGRLQVNRAVAEPPPPPLPPPAQARAPRSKSPGEFNWGLGILGALLGAGVGVGLMYGFAMFAGFQFPLMGIGIGVLTGYGAKLLFKGTDNLLGIISGVIALVAIVGTLYLLYGEFPIMSIISVVVGTGVAYQIASG